MGASARRVFPPFFSFLLWAAQSAHASFFFLSSVHFLRGFRPSTDWLGEHASPGLLFIFLFSRSVCSGIFERFWLSPRVFAKKTWYQTLLLFFVYHISRRATLVEVIFCFFPPTATPFWVCYSYTFRACTSSTLAYGLSSLPPSLHLVRLWVRFVPPKGFTSSFLHLLFLKNVECGSSAAAWIDLFPSFFFTPFLSLFDTYERSRFFFSFPDSFFPFIISIPT